MPTATRRQAQARAQDEHPSSAGGEPFSQDLEDVSADQVIEDDDQDGEEDGEYDDDVPIETFPPPGLKEISSLASWTVSTAKPGSGVAALRSPDTALFWQSDGPQPHLLSIHFFKLVAIVHMRIYLDFESDESYTPTKVQFLAGMGVHDLQEFAEMSFEQPTGWIDVDFSNVGPPVLDGDDDDDEDRAVDWSKRPVLRAFLVQVKILENHQNGKDTHLRAVQLFAKDETYQARHAGAAKAANTRPVRLGVRGKARNTAQNNIKMAPWMLEPDMR